MNWVIACPSCQVKVNVTSDLIGKEAQCPQCRHVFTITDPAAGTFQETKPHAPPMLTPAAADDWDDRAAGSTPRRPRYQEQDDDDLLVSRPATPHRGAAVLTIGILSLVVCGPILGPIAWVMGNNDLREMQEGRMDRTGEGITQAGRVIGIVSTIMHMVVLSIYCLIFMAMAGGGRFR